MIKDYITEYEASFGVSFQSIVILLVTVLSIVVYVLCWKKMITSAKVFFAIVNVVLIILSVSIVSTYIHAIRLIDLYNSGDFETAEGVIMEYTTNDHLNDGVQSLDIDEFYVDDKYFVIAQNNPYGLGYNLRKCDGGKLDNGIQVRIHYIEQASMNIIMKLDLLE